MMKKVRVLSDRLRPARNNGIFRCKKIILGGARSRKNLRWRESERKKITIQRKFQFFDARQDFCFEFGALLIMRNLCYFHSISKNFPSFENHQRKRSSVDLRLTIFQRVIENEYVNPHY